MDKFEENQADSKHIKRKADPESKYYFLRSAKTKEIKDTSFQLPGKIEIKETSDIAQDPTSLHETENFEKNADEKYKKMKIVKNQNNSDLNEVKLFAKKDCQLNADIFTEDRTSMKNRGFKKSKQKLDGTSQTELIVENEKKSQKLPKFKTEKDRPAFKTDRKKSNRTEIKHKRAKIDDSFRDDLKEASSKECNEAVQSPPEIKILSRDAIEKVDTVDIKETAEKPDKNEIPSKEKVNELQNTTKEYIPFSNYFDITIPVMGKIVFQNNDEKPFTKRYDLAVERNKRRFRYMKKTGCDDEILKLIKSEANFSENDKKKNAMEKRNDDIRMACYITKLCIKILKELNCDNISEGKILCLLEEFFFSHVTPTCLLYVPQLVHTISFIRGCKEFSKVLRLIANECYDKCHAMFPVPAGYNFETVYTSEMRKFLPDEFDKMEDIAFDYGDIDDLLEGSDSVDSNVDSFNSEDH